MKQYLLFSSEHLDFGLESLHVREIFPLPELQPIAEAPGDVIGLLNLRGRLTPIIHLAKRLGVAQPNCQVQDSIIILEWQGLQVGLVVNQVRDVQDIAAAQITQSLDLDRDQYFSTALARGYVQLEDAVLTLLHPESLIRQASEIAVLAWETELSQAEDDDVTDDAADDTVISSPWDFYSLCGALSEADRQIFAKRAQDLQAPLVSDDISERQPITIMSIGEDYFGVALDCVREFIHVPKLTQIPSAPSHILGNFNLRGEIMTLLDISAVLDIPAVSQRPKAVILEIDRQRVGVSVDEIHDVLYLAQDDYLTFPATVSQDHQQFLAGAFDYQGRVVRLVDLPALLDRFQAQPLATALM